MMKINSFISYTFGLTVFALGAFALADDDTSGKYPHGIQAEVSVGQGFSAIQNPDNTTAYYQTIAVEGRGHIPLIGGGSSIFAMNLAGGIRYLDLQNTAQMGSEKEVANLIGPEAGLHLRFAKFIGGGQYSFLLARHYAVGPVSREMNYSMSILNYYGGLQIPFGQLAVSAIYSGSSGFVPKANSGLSKDSAYSDQIYWLNLNYSTGASFWRFLEMLF